MSSQDNRYDNTATRKSRWNDPNSSSSKASPDRYRNRNDSKHHNYYKDRKYYDNRSWRDGPYSKRHSYEPNRYRHERKAESSDDKITPPEGERTEAAIPTVGRETTNFTSKRRWNSGTSPPPPATKRPPWLVEQRPLETVRGAYDPQASVQSENSFKLIFNHINTVYSQNTATQPDRPMSFIDRLIADEAMRMLAAASSNETTALNEPCDAAEEAVPANTVTAASDATTGPSQQESAKEGTDGKIASKVASVRAADSRLLQKSAEQVTKKLINQLSTMSKYDLKHMIDNPAGKYETALNRHAQNKLRAEVRKQLKSFGLNELDSSCVTGDGTVESDEAIDADKIPSALLEQIEQALDLNFFDIPQAELNKADRERGSVGTVGAPQSDDEELVEPVPGGEQASICTTSTENSSTGGTNANSSTDGVSGSPTTTAPKNGTKPTATLATPGRKKKIIIRKAANGPSGRPNSFIARKAPTASPTNSVAPSPVPSASNVTPSASASSKDTTDTDGHLLSVEEPFPIAVESNPGARNTSFLRVSTVEELNRRLDGVHGTQSADQPPNDAAERMVRPNDSTSTNATLDATATEMPRQPTAACTTDGERKNVHGHPRQHYRTVDISTVKVLGQSNVTIEALLNYVNNKTDGKRIRIDHPPGGGTVAKEPDDPPTVPDATAPVQTPPRKGNTKKKRKHLTKKNLPSPARVDTQDNSPQKNGAGKANISSPSAAKKGKKWKQKVRWDRTAPLGSTEHSYCAADVLQTSPPQTSGGDARKSPQPIPFEDRILNTAYDEYMSKRVDEAEKNTDRAEQQTAPKSHITIANVCSVSGTTETATSTVGPDTQPQPQEMFPTEPTDGNADQSVQNAVIPAVGTESVLPDWNLTTEATVESKKEIVRIDSPQPSAGETSEEYILGADREENGVQTMDPPPDATNDPQEQTQQSITNDSSPRLPTSSNTASLQSLCAITEHMQSLETQTMELYHRKMQIDAMFMTLHSERMDIDQQLERLHNIRNEQISFMRLNLLELVASSNGSGGGSAMYDIPSAAAGHSGGVTASHTVTPPAQTNNSNNSGSSSSAQVGARQQERTIRRITPINSVLMKIFQRRRAPSERSTEEASSGVDQA